MFFTYLALLLAYLRAWIASKIASRFTPQKTTDDLEIKRVLLFDDTTGDFEDVTWMHIRDTAGSNGSNGSVGLDTPPEFDRMEIRYTRRGKKYRAVVREGESREIVDGTCTRVSEIVSAKLLPSVEAVAEGAKNIDVTTRVRKYFGANKDFGGRVLKCHDIFPFDDPEYMADRFDTLRVAKVGSADGFSVRDFNFKANDAINP